MNKIDNQELFIIFQTINLIMINLKNILISILFLTFIIPEIHAQSVGVSPPFLNLGEIQPGTSKIATFQIVTASEEVSLVQLGKAKGSIDFLRKGEYNYALMNYSEQDILPWIEFISNPVEMTKIEDLSKTKAGGTIKGAKEINFIIKVPKDAEPGYHMGIITLTPLNIQTNKLVVIQAIVPLTFIFKVPGKAVRDAKIFEVSTNGYYNGNLILDIFFQNTGTVTFSILPVEVKIFDKKNNFIDEFTSYTVYVKPGEMKHISALWEKKDVELGNYNAEVKIDYMSGYALKKSNIELYSPQQIPPARVVEKEFVFPWWVVIVLVIVVIVAYMYYRG